jgi:RNA polymerase sigma factor (sigma-70 family)
MVRVLPSDEALLARMAAGDVEAMAAFVERFRARVYGLARRVVTDADLAEEVAQDAFMRAWTHASTFDPRRGRAVAWLLRITRNLAIDALRVRRDLPFDPDVLVDELTGTGRRDQATQADELRYDGADQLRRALRALPAEQARPLVLAVYLGLTAQEIATQEKIPLGTVKTRIRRGLARLRQAGAPHG